MENENNIGQEEKRRVKAILKEEGLKYQDLADQLNLKVSAIQRGLSSNIDTPVWARAFIMGYNLNKKNDIYK